MSSRNTLGVRIGSAQPGKGLTYAAHFKN
jgi:hypothetical protein